jgi:hypothetical protein
MDDATYFFHLNIQISSFLHQRSTMMTTVHVQCLKSSFFCSFKLEEESFLELNVMIIFYAYKILNFMRLQIICILKLIVIWHKTKRNNRSSYL